MFLLVGWILLLPVMWRKRRQLKQMWQFSKATRQAQQQARQQAQNAYQQRQNRQDDSVIEGEYEVKRDDSPILAGVALVLMQSRASLGALCWYDEYVANPISVSPNTYPIAVASVIALTNAVTTAVVVIGTL